MELQAYEQSFQVALTSLATPTLDIGALTSAAQVGILLQGMAILVAFVGDHSLENERTKNVIKRIKNPRSYISVLLQTVEEISGSLKEANRAMMMIKHNLENIPNLMVTIITHYEKPDNKVSTLLVKQKMNRFGEYLKKCSQEAATAGQRFENTMELIQEIIQVAAELPEKMHKYQKSMKVIEQVQQQLSIFIKFLHSLESAINGPMTSNLETIDKIVKAKKFRNGNLQTEMVSTGFSGVALYYSVARVAGIYNQMSEKYVMPLLHGFTEKLTMLKDAAEEELPHIESKIQQITEESNTFLNNMLQEAEKETKNQMVSFRDKVMANLMPASG